MKANGVPEKLYLLSNGLISYCKNTDEDVEYTRTDAFIEKAEKYFIEKFEVEDYNDYIDVDGSFDRGEIVGIEKMSITYTQSADTNSDTDDEQYITIETEIADASTLDSAIKEQSFYFNVKTDKWSINNANDLAMLIEDFKMRIYNQKEKYLELKKKEEKLEKKE